ncbi:hypothetical protein RSAG8_12992, partial [Rhizoctonia solani AG-8 WAC10335]
MAAWHGRWLREKFRGWLAHLKSNYTGQTLNPREFMGSGPSNVASEQDDLMHDGLSVSNSAQKYGIPSGQSASMYSPLPPEYAAPPSTLNDWGDMLSDLQHMATLRGPFGAMRIYSTYSYMRMN